MGTLEQVFILLIYSVFIIDDRIHHRGLTGFRTGLSVMAATKLVDACFLRCFFWVLYRRGGGICGGGLLSTLGDVKGYGGIVWMVGGEITLICVPAGLHRGETIGTLGSGIVTCCIGFVGRECTGAAVWKNSAS